MKLFMKFRPSGLKDTFKRYIHIKEKKLRKNTLKSKLRLYLGYDVINNCTLIYPFLYVTSFLW